MQLLRSLIAGVCLISSAKAACTREFLVDATNTYIAAQTAGNPAALTALTSETLNYTESDKTIDIKTGVLSQPMKIDYNVSIHDTTQCATFTELIVENPAKPWVIGTRMVFTDSKVTLIETIATKPGDWLFNATGYLHWVSQEKWDPIPAEKRGTREVVKAAGDAYFDRFQNINATVPWGTPCTRLEGGAYTGQRNASINTCDLGLPSTLRVTNRRYVVDETMGAVAIYVGFPGLDRTVGLKPMPDSHFFRVEGGKLRLTPTSTMSTIPGPPGPDISRAPLLVGITTLLHAISLPLYGARIWTRSVPTLRLGLDDYFITAAVIFDMINWIFMLMAIHHGAGRHNFYIAPDQLILAEKYSFLSQPWFGWSLAFSKMSIAWMLIRIRRDSRPWVGVMSGIMVLSVGIAICSNVFQLSMCEPIWFIWDHSHPNPVCMDPKKAQLSIYINAGLTIATDIILSFAPITFIVNIQRPLREKIILGLVMGMGMLASAGSIAKTTKVHDYGVTGDTLMDMVGLTLWGELEMQLAIIASCIPTLKQVFEKYLRRLGILSTTSRTHGSRSGYTKQSATGFPNQLPMGPMRSVKKGSNAETDSVESEIPIMKPGVETSVKRDEAGSSMEDINVARGLGIQRKVTVEVTRERFGGKRA
ncbi:hypothetical protein OQA88_4565 [Cercophora sp. LCS_1]